MALNKGLRVFVALLAIGLIAIALFALFIFNLHIFASQKISENLILKNGTRGWELFENTKDVGNLRLSFTLYTVSNPKEVLNKSAKINLQELGPYVYDEFKYKKILKTDDGFVEYKLKRRFEYNAQLSNGTHPKETKVTWLNVPILSAMTLIDISTDSQPIRNGLHSMLANLIKAEQEPAFISDTVENFIFAGSYRKIMKGLHDLGSHLPGGWPLLDDTFGILYKRNDTWIPEKDFTYTVAAGYGDKQTFANINELGRINGSSTLPFWKNGTCNTLGECTDGHAFGTPISKKHLNIYIMDVCRKLRFKFRGSLKYSGIYVHKYTLDETSLQSGSKNPENSCYCLSNNTATCSLDGLIDMATCQKAHEVFASASHFLYGSKELFSGYTGFREQNSTLDEPVLHVEPMTGLPIQAHLPIQFNVRLKPHPMHTLFNFVDSNSSLMVPLVTITESAKIDRVAARFLATRLLVVDPVFTSMLLVFLLVVIFMIVSCLASFCLMVNKYETKRINSSIMSANLKRSSANAGKRPGSGPGSNAQGSSTALNAHRSPTLGKHPRKRTLKGKTMRSTSIPSRQSYQSNINKKTRS